MKRLPLILVLALALSPALAAGEENEVVTTESGLKIEFLAKGKEGTQPKEGERVVVHYTGTLLDGKKFDSSLDRDEPFSFRLGEHKVIPGWEEGVALMNVGAKVKMTIPPELAYGARGRPPVIPGNSTLVFTIELLEVMHELPFVEPDPEKAQTLDSGLKCQVLREGEGEPAGENEGVTLRFALYRESGRLVDSTVKSGAKLAGAVSKLPLEFLREAAPGIRPGGSYLYVVPPELAFGGRPLGPRGSLLPPNTTTVWRIELESKNPIPTFRLPDPEKTKTTESGLRYEVIEEGEGESPEPTDRVKVLYTGWLTDGTLFDSAHGRGEPIVFLLNRVIPGWTEGVGLMKPGAKYLFSIPGKLAYGAHPNPQSGIPPNATLVFLVELISVVE